MTLKCLELPETRSQEIEIRAIKTPRSNYRHQIQEAIVRDSLTWGEKVIGKRPDNLSSYSYCVRTFLKTYPEIEYLILKNHLECKTKPLSQ